LAKVEIEKDFNVLKLHPQGDELSLLDYNDFFVDPFPSLNRSWRVSLSRSSVIFRNYQESRNPPILHRKELLLPKSDPHIDEFATLTETAEGLGLFSDSGSIGFREHWYASIAKRGYHLIAGQFVPIANATQITEVEADDASIIRRHLTALTRSNFSAPVQALSRYGLIRQDITFFDYGCGRGDDVRGLIANGIDATGWDPHYVPNAAKREADVVNIGFVINVIENISERIEAVQGAYSYTRGVLSVAAMLTSQMQPDGRPYLDGYVSARNTFQKYYSQAQLRDFIEHTLDENAIAVGPGVFFIFRDKELEQRFLLARYGHRVQTVLSRGWVHDRKASTPTKTRQTTGRIDRALVQFEANRSLFESLRHHCIELGRSPIEADLEPSYLEEIQNKLGSLSKALKVVFERFDIQELERAHAARTADLIVLVALQQFQKRKPYRHLEEKLQRDVRHFFGDYTSCQVAAKAVLFSIGDRETINSACRIASENGYGWLEEGQSLQFHSSLLERLPTVLRTYVGCATILYGDISEIDLIKIHIRSGKVSLLKFDDFENSPLPRLMQRIKVKLRDLDLDVFTYGEEYPPTLLYLKSRFINEEFTYYSEQMEFDANLAGLALHDLSGYGPSELDFFSALEAARWQIDGFKLIRSRRIPNLDEYCGKNFTYRQLVECGETQAQTKIANLPKEADSYTALYELATRILDLVIDYYGMIKLTYGFCSPELAKLIPGRIAPELDQHAAHERKRNGKPICERLGAACDFVIEDEDMEDVATWVFENTEVDRLYFYGNDRPIHVSYSTLPSRQFVHLVLSPTGKQIPRVVRK
jgi:DNA phosphorothioation-associated putative methyltransferase